MDLAFVAPRRVPAKVVASGEKGYVDLPVGNGTTVYACNTTGSITLVATIAQGASVLQRVNKKIMLKSVQVRGLIVSDTTTTQAGAAIMLIYDRRPTGALPAITDVLVAINSNAFTNNDNQGRFSVLYRRDYALIGNITTPSTGSERQIVNDFVKVNRMAVYKSAGTGAITDIEEGALYLITTGDIVAGTADANAQLNLRTTFKDI